MKFESNKYPWIFKSETYREKTSALKMKILLTFLFLFTTVLAAPWLEILFGGQPPYNYPTPNDKSQQLRRRQGKGGKERWKEICRTINPDPYASAGRVPYPAAPVCPW